MRRSLISIAGITCCSVLLSGCGAIMKPIFKAGFKALSKSGDEIVSGAAKGIGKNSDTFTKGISKNSDSFYTNPSKGYWKEFSDQSSLTSRPLRTLGRTTIGNDEEKDYQNEIAKLNQEIAVKPNHSLYHLRGELKAEHLNDYEGAILDLNKSIELKSDYALAYNTRGIAKHKKGDYEGALYDYNNAINIDPESSYLYNRGLLKAKHLSDFKGAISDFNLAIKIYPKYGKAYISRAIAKTSLGDYTGALSDYTKAIDINGNDTLAFYNRGALKAKYLRNRKTACADFDIAASLGHAGAKKIVDNLDCEEFR